jgi:hypothetical protein
MTAIGRNRHVADRSKAPDFYSKVPGAMQPQKTRTCVAQMSGLCASDNFPAALLGLSPH